MKLRKGFVSNSSSSSFVCDFCGTAEGGFDACLSDFEMSRCENDHIFCNAHALNSFDEAPKSEIYEYLYQVFTSYLENNKKWLNEYKEKLDGKREQTEWEIKNNWAEKIVADYSERVPESEKQIQELISDFNTIEDDYDFHEKYSDTINGIVEDRGVPEKYCPVCQRYKKMQEDELYEQCNELYKHFDGIKPNGCI